MANINPDPHRYGYVFVPLNRITALFTSSEAAKAAVAEVRALGLDAAAIDVFIGEEGADALDAAGLGHGAVVRTLRNFESLMVQVAEHAPRQVDAALRAGAIAVAVLMDDHEGKKDDVAAALRRHDGTSIRYWGRWVIESLDYR